MLGLRALEEKKGVWAEGGREGGCIFDEGTCHKQKPWGEGGGGRAAAATAARENLEIMTQPEKRGETWAMGASRRIRTNGWLYVEGGEEAL